MKLNIGKYKGIDINDIEDISYLNWCIDNSILKGHRLLLAKQKVNYPYKTRYKIEIKNTLNNTDGTYEIKAYSKSHAIRECIKANKILITQNGTEYRVIDMDKI